MMTCDICIFNDVFDPPYLDSNQNYQNSEKIILLYKTALLVCAMIANIVESAELGNKYRFKYCIKPSYVCRSSFSSFHIQKVASPPWPELWKCHGNQFARITDFQSRLYLCNFISHCNLYWRTSSLPTPKDPALVFVVDKLRGELISVNCRARNAIYENIFSYWNENCK